MKLLNCKSALLSFATAMCALAAQAEGCQIAIGVGPMLEGDHTSAALSRQFEAKMHDALSRHDMVAGGSGSQFFITGRIDNVFSSQQPGLRGKVMISGNLHLAIADSRSEMIYSSVTIPVKGVGVSDEQAAIRAISSVKAGNPSFEEFVDKAREKIISFYDNNYNTFLDNARVAMKNRDYDEAIYNLSLIPECSRGYNQARALMLQSYTDNVNYIGRQLLAKAHGAWAADPTEAGASEAYGYLSQIDPSASCYPEAAAFGTQMAKTVKANWDFENKTKYQNEVELERARIEAVKQAAIAKAKSRPQTIYRVNYIWR